MTAAATTDAPEPITLETQQVTQSRTLHLASRPVTFEEFLALFGEDDDVELIDGVVVERTAAQLDHEKLYAWLLTLLNLYVQRHDLGIVLGSRTAVRVSGFRGRIPDLLFVRKERLHIVTQQSVNAAPDLVIELVSPNDCPSDLVPLEADYRSLGVGEIVFIDQTKQSVRSLRRNDAGGYVEEKPAAGGRLRLAALGGIGLGVSALIAEPRPDILATLMQLPPPAP